MDDTDDLVDVNQSEIALTPESMSLLTELVALTGEDMETLILLAFMASVVESMKEEHLSPYCDYEKAKEIREAEVVKWLEELLKEKEKEMREAKLLLKELEKKMREKEETLKELAKELSGGSGIYQAIGIRPDAQPSEPNAQIFVCHHGRTRESNGARHQVVPSCLDCGEELSGA